MVRRVGFGDSEKNAPRRARAQNEPRVAAAMPPARANEKTPPLMQLMGGAFMLFWLVLWSFGILFAIGALTEANEGRVFLMIWLAVAIVVWGAALRKLFAVFRGEPLRKRKPKGSAPRQSFVEPDGDGPGAH